LNIRCILNGKQVSFDTGSLRRLLDVLRDDFGLTGVKEGCGEGECGACSVLIDGKLANSCIVPVGSVQNAEILTIEGFRDTERYRVIENAFAETGAVQCGFCTPGFVMAAEALLRRNPEPGEEEIREAVSGNLCRCTGYHMIVAGIEKASQNGRVLWTKPTDR
jgi:carbon-monoxide dehydrogenase small subunit